MSAIDGSGTCVRMRPAAVAAVLIDRDHLPSFGRMRCSLVREFGSFYHAHRDAITFERLVNGCELVCRPWPSN
jgi:hypothetical protein